MNNSLFEGACRHFPDLLSFSLSMVWTLAWKQFLAKRQRQSDANRLSILLLAAVTGMLRPGRIFREPILYLPAAM